MLHTILQWVEAHKTFVTAASTILTTLVALGGTLVVGQHLEQRIDAPERVVVLLDRVSEAEGEFEGILMKIASERKLSEKEIGDLGLVRQGYQQLRESILGYRSLEWGSSEHPQYLVFKKGGQTMVEILYRERQPAPPRQFEQITDNIHEKRWAELALG